MSHHACSMQVQILINAYKRHMWSSAGCARRTGFESRMFIKAWEKRCCCFRPIRGWTRDRLVAQETVDSFTSCHWALFIVGGCPVFEASVQFGCNGIGSFNNAKEAPTSPEAVPEPGAKALQWIRTYLRCFTYLLFDVICTSKGQPTKPLPFVNVRNLLS